MRVSDFANYLRCPYRFYLSKLMRLRKVHDRLTELDARSFGELTHDVVEAFGKSELADSTDEEQIGSFLAECLARTAKQRFGRHPKPTVQVQLAQLQSRLLAFAQQQQRWRLEGWRIVRTEHAEEQGQLIVDDRPLRLVGRVDRIDHRVCEGVDEYAILDYKTGDVGESPEKKHLRSPSSSAPVAADDWVDLQLPLYRHLLSSVESLSGQDHLRLGYILLPATPSDTRFALAEWTAAELATADEAAANIVRRIRRQEFWPPSDPYPFPHHDEFAAIVQFGVFGREPFSPEALRTCETCCSFLSTMRAPGSSLLRSKNAADGETQLEQGTPRTR